MGLREVGEGGNERVLGVLEGRGWWMDVDGGWMDRG